MKLLRRCVESLNNAAKRFVKLKIIVHVEVESKDEQTSLGSLKGYIHHVYTFVRGSAYTDRNNFALDQTIHEKSDYYLFINDDAWVDKHFLEEMIKTAKAQQTPEFIVPLIYAADPDRQNELDSFGVEYFRSGYPKNAVSLSYTTTLGSFSCIIVSSSFLRKLKQTYGFYFVSILGWYLEDVELSIRARAIGARFVKNQKIIAYHYGSYTWKKRSYFVVFQTYRNILWLIILTWPLKIIVKHLLSILVVQLFILKNSLQYYGIRMYPQILYETIINFKLLLSLRKSILSAYSRTFDFESIFSSLTFRTRNNTQLKL